MPKSWRTDTFMSGMPGTPAWAWAGISLGSGCLCGGRRYRRTGGATRYVLAGSSDEASLLQIVISLYDFAQLVFGPFVSAVGVGVVALNQLLEPGLDLESLGGWTEIQGLQRFQLQRLQGPPRLRCPVYPPIEEVVRIAEAAAVPAGMDRTILRTMRRGIRAHFPGRPMAREAVLLVCLDLGVAHARKVV